MSKNAKKFVIKKSHREKSPLERLGLKKARNELRGKEIGDTAEFYRMVFEKMPDGSIKRVG